MKTILLRGRPRLRLPLAIILTIAGFPFTAFAQAPSTVTALPYSIPLSVASISNWSLVFGVAGVALSAEAAPDGTAVIEVTPTSIGTVVVQNDLTAEADLRNYDSFLFWAKTSRTGIGSLVLLVDRNGWRRWYVLTLGAANGWQQEHYWFNHYLGQDPQFDLAHVKSIQFGQSGQSVNNKIDIGAVSFRTGLIDNADAPSSWWVDIGDPGSVLLTSTDAVAGTSILAAVVANSSFAPGQADIVTTASSDYWDLSGKQYISFAFKDNNPGVLHYFLIYAFRPVTNDFCYRQWLFDNSSLPDRWTTVTVGLRDGASVYSQSCGATEDLSNVIIFEVGLFNGIAGHPYSFRVDEIRVR